MGKHIHTPSPRVRLRLVACPKKHSAVYQRKCMDINCQKWFCAECAGIELWPERDES